jgi:hypothetical protein
LGGSAGSIVVVVVVVVVVVYGGAGGGCGSARCRPCGGFGEQRGGPGGSGVYAF